MKQLDLAKLDVEVIDQIIAMAWADRISFEVIKEKTGLCEADVIFVMRRSLKLKSFRFWRARVSGRATKHQKRFRKGRKRIYLQIINRYANRSEAESRQIRHYNQPTHDDMSIT